MTLSQAYREAGTPNLLFFDDFENDIGWASVRSGVPVYDTAPSRWDYYVASTCDHEILAGVGRNGSAGYRLKYDILSGQRETGRLAAVFPESPTIHMRSWQKLSEGYQMGVPGLPFFWKQYRFQQSGWGDTGPHSGINGENFSGYNVTTMIGGDVTNYPFTYEHHAAWRDDPGNSASGAQIIYKDDLDQVNNAPIPWGDYNPATRIFTNTDWVQVDILIELGDRDQDNGRIVQWFNGVPSTKPWEIVNPAFGGVAPITGDGLVTNPRYKNGRPGYNSFTLWDNYNNLTGDWLQQHYIFCDSIYIWDRKPDDLPEPS